MSEPNFEASEPVGEPITPSLRTAVARKQNSNVYTVMLIISFVCLLIGTLLLFLNLQQYGSVTDFPWKVNEGKPKEVLKITDTFRG